MKFNKSTLGTAMIAVMGGVSMSAQAALTASASLSFNAGTTVVTSCLGGTTPPCNATYLNVTDVGGSYFRMNQGGTPSQEKTAISQFAPIHLGTTQTSSGQHTGLINGSESPAIDNAWNFFFNTGMHTLTSPVSVISNLGSGVYTLDFSGWGVNWGNYGPGGTDGGTIPMGGIATITCSTVTCSDSSTYTLDMAVHVPAAFTSVPYTLHLEGHVNGAPVSAVPVPAAAWLLGSGLVGLVGVARRRRQS